MHLTQSKVGLKSCRNGCLGSTLRGWELILQPQLTLIDHLLSKNYLNFKTCEQFELIECFRQRSILNLYMGEGETFRERAVLSKLIVFRETWTYGAMTFFPSYDLPIDTGCRAVGACIL